MKGAPEAGGPGPGSTESTGPDSAAVAAEAVKCSQDPMMQISSCDLIFLEEGCVMDYLKRKPPKRPR